MQEVSIFDILEKEVNRKRKGLSLVKKPPFSKKTEHVQSQLHERTTTA